MRATRTWILATVCLLAFVPAARSDQLHIHTINFSFSPSPVDVALSDTVQWDNHDGVTHTVTDVRCPRAGGPGPCEFDSVFTMTPGSTFTHVFFVGGTFQYKCTIHGFQGILNVNDPNTRPDLGIEALASSDVPTAPLSKRIDVTVRNEGGVGAGESKLLLMYLYKNVWRNIQEVSVDPIPAGATQTVAIFWNFGAKLGDFDVQARADSQNQVVELREFNNEGFGEVSLLLPPDTLDPGKDLTNP